MQAHLVQLGYDDAESPGERLDRVEELVLSRRGADLVVLPELWGAGGFASRTWAERAESLDGPTITRLSAAARSIGAVVHVGSILERGPAGPQGRGLWNTGVVLGRDGAVAAVYRKIHRFGFGGGEPRLVEAGEAVVVVDLPLGVGGAPVRTGLATCYDLRFPELFRALLDAGAELVIVPAAWPAARIEHWDLLVRARALENQSLVVAVNTAGTHARTPMGGRSQVVGPDATVIARAGDDAEEVVVVDLDPDVVARTRQAFPVLADRRL